VVLATLALAFICTDAYRRARIERMWQSAILHIDAVIDEDLPASEGTRKLFFDYVTTLVGAFGEREVMERPAMLEVVSWLYVVRACREMLGFDPIETMRQMWADYSPDAVRTLAREPVTSAETLGRALSCFVTSYTFAGRILGLSEERARLLGELDTPSRTAADTLRDWLQDAQARRLMVPREELDRRGISVEDVFAHSSSWDSLALVDGLAEWCIEEAREQRVWLEETVLPRMRMEVIPYIRPRWRRSRWLLQLKSRVDVFARGERQWRQRAGAARAAHTGGSDSK
jgi:hypothetical protein